MATCSLGPVLMSPLWDLLCFQGTPGHPGPYGPAGVPGCNGSKVCTSYTGRWLGNIFWNESIEGKEEREGTDFPWEILLARTIGMCLQDRNTVVFFLLMAWFLIVFWGRSLMFSHRKTTGGSPGYFHRRLWVYANQKRKLGMQNWSFEKSDWAFQCSLMPFVSWRHPPFPQNGGHERTNYSSFKETAIKKFLAQLDFCCLCTIWETVDSNPVFN